jgi:hypothetical protein
VAKSADVVVFKSALADGKTLSEAMQLAGYSVAVAKTGRRGLSSELLAVLEAYEKGKKAANELIAYRKGFSIKEVGSIVEARLLKNAVEGTDAGAVSAKTLGGHKDLKLWQPDTVVGVQINQLSPALEKLITLEAEES